jgi:hypothetical protein
MVSPPSGMRAELRSSTPRPPAERDGPFRQDCRGSSLHFVCGVKEKSTVIGFPALVFSGHAASSDAELPSSAGCKVCEGKVSELFAILTSNQP